MCYRSYFEILDVAVTPQSGDRDERVMLPGWLIEPDTENVRELSRNDLKPFTKCAPIVNELFTM